MNPKDTKTNPEQALTPELKVRLKLANAPHPKSDALTVADLGHLPLKEREAITRAQARREAQKARRART